MSAKKTKKAPAKKPAAAKRSPTASAKASPSTVKISRSASQRIHALSRMGGDFCEDTEKLQGVLNTIKDTTAPLPVRMTALQTMLSASFSAPNFNACRPDFLATLRSVAADKNIEIRERVLGILSREHDGYAQQVLMQGLQDPAKALLPPEKALQLLSYDIHADAYPLARKIVQNPPNEAAKREALRLLAADAASAPMFEKLLKNKKEAVDVRQLSAAALNSLAPEKLQQHARKIVLDKSEGDQLRATSLTAITHFADETATAKDNALYKGVDKLKTGASSPALKRVSKQFLAKYSR
jgi:hypothetical protein